MDETQLGVDETNAPPNRILLAPKGDVVGRDKRVFHNDDANRVLNAFKCDKRDIPIDIDHGLERDGRGAAHGWIKDLEVEQGAIYGKVEWNSLGRSKLENKEYRYISPVFLLDKDRRIKKIESVGMVNKPNLYLRSLNSEGAEEEIQEEDVMGEKGKLTKELCVALGLEEGASETAIVAAVGSLKAELNVQRQDGNSGTEMVPKADYEVVLKRAEEAEQQLKIQADEALKKEANAAITGAVVDGKIAPASKEYYMELCTTQEGLDKFKEFAKSAPQMLIGDAGVGGTKELNTADLDAEEKALCSQLGLSEEIYKLGKGV